MAPWACSSLGGWQGQGRAMGSWLPVAASSG
eukprot:CAMPEP_0202882180 /NCGR_PEP_ID=MMETSP1391-20130828/37644_1 /ASSEMBLY_ACC=CAM_ASM_000867 /TAXON_ID=1034604 /ORGANISM="Chlamydomonas leiostraca, Strain SAG 11-49" /LENGTH=30 /DNA_ID= /DNA_START= /DNA_END= /DNA_ORIENTATION=